MKILTIENQFLQTPKKKILIFNLKFDEKKFLQFLSIFYPILPNPLFTRVSPSKENAEPRELNQKTTLKVTCQIFLILKAYRKCIKYIYIPNKELVELGQRT